MLRIGGRSTPSVFSRRFSVAKKRGDFDRLSCFLITPSVSSKSVLYLLITSLFFFIFSLLPLQSRSSFSFSAVDFFNLLDSCCNSCSSFLFRLNRLSGGREPGERARRKKRWLGLVWCGVVCAQKSALRLEMMPSIFSKCLPVRGCH